MIDDWHSSCLGWGLIFYDRFIHQWKTLATVFSWHYDPLPLQIKQANATFLQNKTLTQTDGSHRGTSNIRTFRPFSDLTRLTTAFSITWNTGKSHEGLRCILMCLTLSLDSQRLSFKVVYNSFTASANAHASLAACSLPLIAHVGLSKFVTANKQVVLWTTTAWCVRFSTDR